MKKQIYLAPEIIEIRCDLESVIMSGSTRDIVIVEPGQDNIDAQAKYDDDEFWY